MITEAIILAGGLGTRLRSAVPNLPKCMAPVAGKPFLKYVIDYFVSQGISKFIFSVGYLYEDIEKYLHQNFPQLNYDCSIENEPLGTGGAVLKACSMSRSKNVLVLNGDTLFEINLKRLSEFHSRMSAECTLTLKKMRNTERYGIVETNANGKVVSFSEKKWYSESNINGGVYALNISSFLDNELPQKFSFEKDYLEKLYTAKEMYAIIDDGYFIDIGVPSDYEKAQVDFSQKNGSSN